MKILWLVNIIMPELAEHLGQKPSVFGGWLSGALEAVRASGYELVICTTEQTGRYTGRYEIDGVVYHVVKRADFSSMQAAFRTILAEEKPDLVHLYGTEFEHTWAMASITDPEKTLVSIQGLVTFCAEHVYGGVPDTVARDTRLHRLLRRIHRGGTSIELQRKNYIARSTPEINTLKTVRNVNGGTSWGDSCARMLQPGVHLFPCGLILRKSFYEGRLWDLDNCERHSIFTFYSSPIKGFDMFLRGLRYIVERYPDTHVYVAGNKCAFRRFSGLKRFIMDHAPDYDWYVQGLIEKNGLKDHITFMGYLDERGVLERVLRSHVFVSPSAMENHSTALGEAMISGVPSVASCVGGLQEMIDHGKDGFLYPFNEPYMMANYVCRLFENDELASRFSAKGREHAARTYDRLNNAEKLLDMYRTIADRGE